MLISTPYFSKKSERRIWSTYFTFCISLHSRSCHFNIVLRQLVLVSEMNDSRGAVTRLRRTSLRGVGGVVFGRHGQAQTLRRACVSFLSSMAGRKNRQGWHYHFETSVLEEQAEVRLLTPSIVEVDGVH